MDVELLLRLLAGIALIGANAFFVAVEFALTRLRGLDLEPGALDDEGLRRAWALTERLEIHLTGCQLGISSTSVLLGVVAEPAVTRLVEPIVGLVGLQGGSVRAVSVAVAVVILNLVHKVWGEQAPTYLGVERPLEVARALAPALAVWSRVMRPVILLGDGAAKASLRLFGVEITRSWLAAEADADPSEAPDRPRGRRELTERIAGLLASADDVPADRRTEVLQALRIDEVEVGDIMVPESEVVWLALDDPLDEWRRRIGRAGRVRYPVLASSDARAPRRLEDVAGTLYVPALFTDDGDGRPGDHVDRSGLLAPALHVSADLPVSALIDRLQDENQELALATGPDHPDRVVGLVTISDAFEVIAGDLRDPLDVLP